MKHVWLVARKDLLIERRSRILLWQILPFGVMALLLSGLALGPRHAGHSSAAPGMFYIVLLWVTVLLVHRSHGIEESVGTRASVATLPIDPASVFFGKALALMIQLWVTAFVLLSGAVVLLHVALHGAVVASGSVAVCIVALAFAGTLYGALSSGPSGQSSLLALLSLPAFAPLLIAGERSFSAGLYGGNLKEWWLLLLTGVVAYSAAGYFLYGVIEDY